MGVLVFASVLLCIVAYRYGRWRQWTAAAMEWTDHRYGGRRPPEGLGLHSTEETLLPSAARVV